MTSYNELRKINVNEHTEKKGNLTYLSWAWAVDTLLQNDPTATWEFPEAKFYANSETVMVFCNVTAFGKTMYMQLPVMDHKNQAIKNPDARKISDATMRCLAKCIACFGIGLYIYAGEDVPQEDVEEVDVDSMVKAILDAKDMDSLKKIYTDSYNKCTKNPEALKLISAAKDKAKDSLNG